MFSSTTHAFDIVVLQSIVMKPSCLAILLVCSAFAHALQYNDD